MHYNRRLNKTCVLIALAMLILGVPFVSAAHAFTGRTTHDLPLTTLDIEATLPEYSHTATITIEGRTKPLATIHAYVNDIRVRVINTREDGRFRFTSVALKPNAENKFTLEAREGENVVRKDFTITHDGTPPAVKLDKEIPQATQAASITVSGDVDEKVTILYRIISKQDRAAPDIIGSLKASKVEKNAVELTWDPSTANDFKEYLIERDGKRLATTTLTSFRDENLESGKTYSYSVSAVDSSCNSGTSADISVTTTPGGEKVTPLPAREVRLSCEPEYSTTAAGSPFSIMFTLAQGFNDIEIIFRDAAGNEEVITQTVVSDVSGPAFESTNLKELSPSYAPEVKIKGKLNEQATVFVYINDEKKPSAFDVTDADGSFSIKIRLRTDVRVKKGLAKTTVEVGEGWANSIKLEAVDLAGNKATFGPADVNFLLCGSGTWWQTNIGEAMPSILLPRLMLQGVQQIGIPFTLSYIGGNEVTAPPLVDVRAIQLAPAAAKDYDHDWVQVSDYAGKRTTKNYTGYVQVQFQNVDSLPDKPEAGANERERALSEHRKDECLVPGVGCVKLFLVMEVKFQESLKLTAADPNIPLPTPQFEPSTQRVCMPVEIAIDKTIPTEVVPKGLLKSSLKFIEKALHYIDKVLKPLTTIGEYILYGCLASHVWLIVQEFQEKLACEGSEIASRFTGSGGWDKAVAEAGLCDEVYEQQGTATQSEEDKQKHEYCTKCEKTIESRTKFKTDVMHGLCDRIHCPSAPTLSYYIKTIKSGDAKPLKIDPSKIESQPEIKKWALPSGKEGPVLYAGNDCAFSHERVGDFITPKYQSASGKLSIRNLYDVAKGTPVSEGPTPEECRQILHPAHPNCCGVQYQREWSSACGIGTVLGSDLDLFDELKESTCLAAQQANVEAPDLNCNRIWNSVAGFCEKNTGQPTVVPVNTDASWVGPQPTRQSADGDAVYVFVVPVGIKIKGLPELGIATTTAQRYRVVRGYMTRAGKGAGPEKQEKVELEEIEFEVGGLKPVPDVELTEFFTQTPQEKQPSEAEQLQKFAKAFCEQSDGWRPLPCEKDGNVRKIYQRVNDIVGVPDQQYIVQPKSGFLRSIQCVCIPAVTSYLHMWQKVLGLFYNCFNKILLTGEGSEGSCAAKFSGTICDLLYETISCFTQKFTSAGAGTRVDTGKFGDILSALTGAGTAVTKDVNERYGETGLYKSLFSERKLVHAICTWAFTGTWDLDVSGLFQQQVEEVPVDSMGALTTCQRTWISYDPTTSPPGLTTWAYRISGGIIAGSDLRYALKLKCSSGFTCDPKDYRDGRCDCQAGEKTMTVSSPDLGNGIARKLDMVDFDTTFAVNPQQSGPEQAGYRYDTALLEWEWTDSKTKQVVRDHVDCSIRETEGGEAPAFCTLDLFSGKFRCMFGEQEAGIRILKSGALYPEGQEAFALTDNLSFFLDIKQRFPEDRARAPKHTKFLTYDVRDDSGTTITSASGDTRGQLLKIENTDVSQQYKLEIDGTYRWTVPRQLQAPDIDPTPLGRFTLDQQTILNHMGRQIGAPAQDYWPIAASQLVTNIRVTDKDGKAFTDKRLWFVIRFPRWSANIGGDHKGEETFEIYQITSPDPARWAPPKGAQGWREFWMPQSVLTSDKQSPGQQKRIMFNDDDGRQVTIDLKHIVGFNVPEFEILVGYIPPAKAQQVCDPNIPVFWTAIFTIYDANGNGYPSEQVSADPETGKEQKETVRFQVRCGDKTQIKKTEAPAAAAPAPQPSSGAPPTVRHVTEADLDAKPIGEVLIVTVLPPKEHYIFETKIYQFKFEKQADSKWVFVQFKKTPEEDFEEFPVVEGYTAKNVITGLPQAEGYRFEFVTPHQCGTETGKGVSVCVPKAEECPDYRAEDPQATGCPSDKKCCIPT